MTSTYLYIIIAIRNLMALVLAAALLMWAGREVLIARDAESARLAMNWYMEINCLKRDLERGCTEHSMVHGGLAG